MSPISGLKTKPYPNSEFSFKIPSFHDSNTRIDIMKPLTHPSIHLMCNVELDDMTKKGFVKLNDKKKMEFIVRLKINLQKFDIGFVFKPDIGDIHFINFRIILFPEDITKTSFMQELRKMCYATQYLATVYGLISLSDDELLFP